jgi:hypothetical protein
MVLHTMTVPEVIVPRSPSPPPRTASTCRPSTTITITLAHSAPTWAGSRAARPPAAVKRASGSGATS